MIEKHNIMNKIKDYVIPIYGYELHTSNDIMANDKILLKASNGDLIKENGWVFFRYQLKYFMNGKESTKEDYFDSLSDEDKEDWVFHLDEINEENMWQITSEIEKCIGELIKQKAQGQPTFRRVV